MKPLQSCKLCLQPRVLCKSHAIPDEFFKLIYRKNSGKAILLPPGDQKIQYSQDSGAVHLLCNNCETLFNETCDKYSILLIKNLPKKISLTDNASKVDIENNKLRLFCLSVLWRGSISSALIYKQLTLNDEINEIIRSSIINKTDNFEDSYSIRIVRLIDTSKNGFSTSNIDGLLILPFQSASEAEAAIFKFVAIGFAFEIYIGKPSENTLRKFGFVNRNESTVLIPNEDIFDHPDFISGLAKGREKHLSGKTQLPVNS